MDRSTSLKQLIPGNPGTSFVVCLLYILHQKYGFEITGEEQIEIFTKGITKSPLMYHTGILAAMASKFDKNIQVYTNNIYLLKIALEENRSEKVSYERRDLDLKQLLHLLDDHEFVTLSVDIHSFYPYYHDYHFCCVEKCGKQMEVFEPKQGTVRRIDEGEFGRIVQSVERELGDSKLVFCC